MVALVIAGAALAIVAVVLGAGEGVTSAPADCRRAVTVSAPDTVPVCSATLAAGNNSLVLPAGMVKLTVVPPVENWIVESPPRNPAQS